MVASVTNAPSSRCSVMTRNDSSRKNVCFHPVATRISSSREPSATSKW